MGKLAANPNIRFAFVDEHLVVLDLERGSYVLFEPVAASMWRECLDCESPQSVIDRLLSHYEIEEHQLASDYDAFIERCVAAKYLVTRVPEPSAGLASGAFLRPHTSFLTLRAWWSLHVTSRDLTRVGFGRVYEQLAVPFSAQRGSRDQVVGLRQAVRAFSCAENLFHLRRAPEDCLPRSLALFRFLRGVGLPATHYIGVRLFPFMAHAWVAYRGCVIRDSPEFCASFQHLAWIRTWTTS